MGFADFAADSKSVGVGQHDVEQREVETLRLDTGESGGRAVAGVDGKSLVFQIQLDEIRDFGFIVHDENLVGHPPVLLLTSNRSGAASSAREYG